MSTLGGKRTALAAILAAAIVAGVGRAGAESGALARSVIGAAGSPAVGAGLVSNGTLAQPTPAGRASGGGIILHAGFWGPLAAATGIAPPDAAILRTDLRANHPNPFNPTTLIEYALAGPCRVRLEVFDPKGRLVRILVDGQQPSGVRRAVWDGVDAAGRHVASGVYFCRLRAGGYESIRKMTLVK